MHAYFKYNGMEKTEITDVDSVSIRLDDGTEVELTYRKTDEIISLSANGSLVLLPCESNVVRVRVER